MRKTKNKIDVYEGVVLQIGENYLIQNNIMAVYKLMFDTGKYYIGSTSNLRLRIQVYKSNYIYKKFNIKNLESEANKSKHCFVQILEIITDKTQLLYREDFFIKKLYNENILNRSKTSFSNKGIKWTQEEKMAISKGTIGQKRSEATRKKMSEAKKNQVVSAKTRKKISISLKKGAAIAPNKIEVYKYSLEGKLVQTYPSIRIAALKIGCSIQTVRKMINEENPRPYKRFFFKKSKSDNPFCLVSGFCD